MMTAVLVARNIIGQGSYDPRRVNIDAEYHAEASTLGVDDDINASAITGPSVPGCTASA